MYLATYLLATYGLLEVTAAFKLPFHLPWASARLNDEQLPLALPKEQVATNRIAIVGAGAGGSSAAFFIGKAKERYGLDVEVDIFDSNSYVGGRSTTVWPYDNPEYEPVELGASIFVGANKNLWRATEEFELERYGFEEGDSMGIWDGTQFVLTTGQSKVGSWWDSVKVIWRYGFQAPMRTKKIVEGMISEFVTLYNSTWGSQPFTDLTDLAANLGWTATINRSTMTYFDAQGINARWTREMVEAATRVNYGQNADEIHGLEGLCSLATTEAASVKGGNWRIFEQFVKRSNATLHLNTTVRSITQLNEDKYTLQTLSAGSASVVERNYRAVILAAPLHGSSIKVSLTDAAAPIIPPQPYVHLHVTLLSTPNPHARTRFFKLKPNDKVPTMILTTLEGARQRGDGSEPEFNSMSYHGKVKTLDGMPAYSSIDATEEWVVKIFSKQRVEDSWLRKAFGKVGWVHRKEWDAYPVLPPTDTFPPVKLAKGFYYVNSFEPFISTMETETISGRNIAELLLQEEFNASICKPSNATEADEPKPPPEDFVYGWDC